MNHLLLVISGPEKGRVFTLLEDEPLVIGRGKQSHTKINDPFMSREHCKLLVTSDTVTLIDLSNGNTFQGGDKIEHATIASGDEFKAGSSVFRYMIGDLADERTIRGFVSPAASVAPVSLTASTMHDLEPDTRDLRKLIGRSFSHYRIDSVMAVGSTGFVYKGTDTEKNRAVAIKVLFPDRTSDDEERDRFIRAMKTMLPIRHPNLIRLYNAGKSGPFCWASMEYVDGENLSQVIDRIGIEGMLDWRDVWRIGVDVASALQEACEHKIIHRNVTPANIIRRKADKVCLLGDLMLSKAIEGSHARQVTSPGTLVGSLAYMSPEQTKSDASVDSRSDIYCLGATLYALLTGRPPFHVDSMYELIRQIREVTPEPPRKFQMSVQAQFEDIVLKMLSKSPADRFDAPSQLLRELERIGKYNGLIVPK